MKGRKGKAGATLVSGLLALANGRSWGLGSRAKPAAPVVPGLEQREFDPWISCSSQENLGNLVQSMGVPLSRREPGQRKWYLRTT